MNYNILIEKDTIMSSKFIQHNTGMFQNGQIAFKISVFSLQKILLSI